jgi:anaerobic selenocysteine-containing dehydrogenase
MADIILPTSTFAEKEGSYTNMTRHVQAVKPATLPQGTSKPDLDIFCELAEALNSPFSNTDINDVQKEIERVVPCYSGTLPGSDSRQWVSSKVNENPKFRVGEGIQNPQSSQDYPFKLVTNNHMFHIGSYTQHAKALLEIGPDCRAVINPEDGESLNVETGDRIVVQSGAGKLEVSVELSEVTPKGIVYIPKNWVNVPVNQLRNGEEGLIAIKVSKVE